MPHLDRVATCEYISIQTMMLPAFHFIWLYALKQTNNTFPSIPKLKSFPTNMRSRSIEIKSHTPQQIKVVAKHDTHILLCYFHPMPRFYNLRVTP